MPYKIMKWDQKKEPTTDELDDIFKRRNLEYYTFSNSAGYQYEKHNHEYNKLLVMAKGKMKWFIDGKNEILNVGDAVVLPKNTLHEVFVIEDCECWEGHF